MKSKKVFFARILFFTLCVSVGFVILKNFDSINEKKSELSQLQEVEESLRIRNEELEERLQAEVDYDYIEKRVKEMGYRKPNAIIFYVYSD